VASDDREAGVLQHAAQLVRAVDAQLVGAGRTVSATVLQELRLVHHATRPIKPPFEPQRAAAGEQPFFVLAQACAELGSVQGLEHKATAGREHAAELPQGRAVALVAKVAERGAEAQHRSERPLGEREPRVGATDEVGPRSATGGTPRRSEQEP
jgi:hypothetical protein